ncbi:hypothetical protein EYC87_07470 [Halieaceae bacterium IMCC8485]|jgi:hypothetical protein|uniref:Uncharacterized protein n=1 Tax=Candidatus Seongchinamella marina TaxID=2518990 RepID=A0ABT3SU14_9GAMM|nr:hypothetical protein [Candidatus Seongchinamella marina]MCX2973425.1 hypothetical protein [Candidatus Seongchinamella marina]
MSQDDGKLSTTALARKLDIPVQQLFATLRDYGWIQRSEETWVLLPKGEFEGGSYQNSRRFGRYIVWPQTLDRHPLLAAIESNKRITAASMRRYYSRLHARQINRALAEIGLQHHSILGWELTDLGRSMGGQQEESEASGAFYVTWPHEVIDHPVVHRELTRQSDQMPTLEPGDSSAEPDLFASAETKLNCDGIDGHLLRTPLQMRVCNWLYLAQLVHAYRRALPTEELVYADFYLPAGSVYIDCWEEETSASDLRERLNKREVYRDLGLCSLEVNASDVDSLDEVLGRGLLALGIRC